MSRDPGQVQKISLGQTTVGGQPMPWFKGVVAGDFVFLSGTAGAIDDGGNDVSGIEEQTNLAFDRAAQALEEAGSSLTRAVRINQYLADRRLRDQYVAARTKWLSANAPDLLTESSYASILVEQVLMTETMLIEVEVTALR